jgi:hypothetical protein
MCLKIDSKGIKILFIVFKLSNSSNYTFSSKSVHMLTSNPNEGI